MSRVHAAGTAWVRIRALARSGACVALCLPVACGGAHPVTSGAMRAYEVSLAVSGTRAALAWHGGPGEHNDIYMEWLDAGGRAASAPLQITHGSAEAFEPDLQLLGAVPVIAWYQRDTAGVLSAWLARLDGQGHVVWRQPLSGAGGLARNPVVRASGNAIAVAWIETPRAALPAARAVVPAAVGQAAVPPQRTQVFPASPAARPPAEVWAELYDPEGRVLMAPVRAGAANDDTWNLNAAVDGLGRFHIVYDSHVDTRHHTLQLAIVDHGQVRHLLLSPDGPDAVYPDLRFSHAGAAALTWFDERGGRDEVYFDVLPGTALAAGHGSPSGRVLMDRRVEESAPSSFGSYLAWNADRLAVAWCDNRSGGFRVYVRTFDSLGRPLGRERELSRSGATGSIPSVQPYGTGFLVAWNEYRSSPGPGHGRILSSVAMTARIP